MNIQDRFKDYKTIVIKVGTSTITYPNGNLNFRMIDRLCWMMSDLKNRDKNVVLVSSGAIGVGSKRLGFETRPQLTREKQAITIARKLFPQPVAPVIAIDWPSRRLSLL